MAIPNPNPNIADGIKSDNKTYSSNKIESMISTSQLPEIGEGDTGKVVTVGADGYELDTTVVPVLTAISASDFFEDDSNVTSFEAYQYGDIIIIQRLVISGVTYTGGNDNHIQIKSAFRPATSIRIPFDDGASISCERCNLTPEGKFATVGITSSSTMLYLYSVTYVVPTI